MIKWHFLNTGLNTGRFNMDFDLYLTEVCSPGEAFLRVYRWQPYCISLGANQNYESIRTKKAEDDFIDVVKRPTGGRAILHAEEITYSVIFPLNENSSARSIYNEINCALLEGLKIYDRNLVDAELENIQPDFKSFYKEEISAVCFAASAKSEVKFSGKKLIGSAQRKMNNVILQHGSLLCGDYHKRIAGYLNASSSTSNEILNQIDSKTTDIKSILNEDVDYERLISSIKSGFEKYFKMKFSDKEKINYSTETVPAETGNLKSINASSLIKDTGI